MRLDMIIVGCLYAEDGRLTVMDRYFRSDEEPKARVPKNFMQGFLEVSSVLNICIGRQAQADTSAGPELNVCKRVIDVNATLGSYIFCTGGSMLVNNMRFLSMPKRQYQR